MDREPEHIDDIKEREIADREATEAYIASLESENKALKELLKEIQIRYDGVISNRIIQEIKEALNS